MAVHRIPCQCNACKKPILLRIVIEDRDQPIVLTCPHCNSELRARFFAGMDELYTFRSDDLTIVDDKLDGGLAIMASTSLPIHSSFWGTPVDAIFMSPFFHLIWKIGQEPVSEIMSRIEPMRRLRESWYPPLRRAATFYARRDMDGMRDALKALPGGDEIEWNTADPENIFDNAVRTLYEQFEDPDARRAANDELFNMCRLARDRNELRLRDLLNEFSRTSFPEHKERVMQTAFAALSDFDALYPAMWVELMHGKVLDLNEYRVMRDDFPTRKTLYQDIFELGSRTLAFVAPIANIAKRGEANVYVDGKRRTLNRALKETAATRERWMREFPSAKKLYTAVSRQTRNNIGHALVRYDVGRNVLVYEDGTEQNYLIFLIDGLSAVKLSHYLVSAAQILEYAHERLNRSPSNQ